MSTEKIKWHTDNMPEGYPKNCDDSLLNTVIQDLNDEYVTKKKNGKINKIWEDIILQLIKSGREELQSRKNVNKPEKSWFSMDNPFVYILVIVVLAFLASLAYTLEWPLRFGSN